MKDWKAEYDKLRGELAEARRQLEQEERRRYEREERDREVQDKFKALFKELLIDVLGR